MKITLSNGITKAAILIVVAGALIALLKYLPARTQFGAAQLHDIINNSGYLGPLILSGSCALGTCLFIPGTFFVGVGAAIFGPFWGFVCVWPGIMAGAAMSYFTARKLGRDSICSLIGNRLARYDDLIEQNGFRAVLFLRLMFVPFGPLNYAAGLTKVKFRDFFLATAVGEAITILAITFFIGQIRSAWISGDEGRLSSTGMAVSVLVLLVLGIIAGKLHKKYAPNRRTPN
jgi:uncharacterized membrane protein YdjX (TVP38/TMEM64 family)